MQGAKGFETMASQDSEFPNGTLTLEREVTATWNFQSASSGGASHALLRPSRRRLLYRPEIPAERAA